MSKQKSDLKPPWAWGIELGTCMRVIMRTHFGSRGQPNRAGSEITRVGPIHAIADVIHGWTVYERQSGQDCRITLAAYKAALKVAEGKPPYVAHKAAAPAAAGVDE